MKQDYIPKSDTLTQDQRDMIVHAATLSDAKAIAPWACRIIEVDGGYQAFESADDYETWLNQG